MKQKSKAVVIAKFAVLIFILIGLPIILFVNYRDTLFNSEWLADLPELLQSYRTEAVWILTAVQMLQIIICFIPGQPIQFAASYMFGVIGGYLISVAGAVLGTIITFHLAKTLGKDILYALFGEEKIEEYKNKLNSGKGLMLVLLIYFLPGVPKDLVCYAAGISDMRFVPFLIVSTIGRSPGMLGSLLIGHFFSQKNYAALAVLGVITIVILILFYIYREKIYALLDKLEEKDERRLASKHGKTQ